MVLDMEVAITVCLSFGIALAVFALNLQIEAAIIRSPTTLGKIIRRLGYYCLGAGLAFILIWLLLFFCLKLLTWSWLSMGITLVLLALALIVQWKRLTRGDLEKFGQEICTTSIVLIVIAVIIVIGFGIFLVLTNLK